MVTSRQNYEIGRKTILLATDQNQSVLAEVNQSNFNPMRYSTHGHLSATYFTSTHLGFNGEHRELHTGWYLLGNGHRTYNSVLMRFHSPDKLSPFGAGGLNPYTYCAADPINNRDPTGRAPLPVILSLAGVGGGTSSLGGMILALSSSARFGGQGISALGTGATGLLLGAAAVANPASVVAPILAGASMTAGVASMALAYRAARAATARGTQWFQSVIRAFDNPPRYSTLSLVEQPPAFSSLNLNPPPPYSPPGAQSTIAPTHSTARAASPSSREALSNSPEPVTYRMSELPQLQFIDETAKRIRAPKR